MKRKLFMVSALAVSLLVAGCTSDNSDVVEENTAPVENPVEEAEEAVEEAKDEAEEALDQAEEAEEKVEEAEEAIDEATDQVWPASYMAHVPEFEGTIFKINEKDVNHMYVAFEEVDQEDAVEYVQTLKDAGFTVDADEYIASTVVNFKGNDKDGNFVKFRWSENGYATVDMVYPEEE